MRLAWTAALCLVAAGAQANGAMGLGLEMFDLRYWLVYVAVIVLFEAWYIGRRSGVGWPKSLAISALANAITGLCCTNVAAVGLHSFFVGTQLNPNPFWNAVVLFAGFGLFSSLIEYVVWSLAVKGSKLFGRSLAAHLIGVLISLGILLIPAYPYHGLEATTRLWRRVALERWATRELQSSILEANRIPSFQTLEEAIRALPTHDHTPDHWAAAYWPKYGRFATSEDRELPYEWNTELGGKRTGMGDEHWVWIIRPPVQSEFKRVIEVDISTGEVRARTVDK